MHCYHCRDGIQCEGEVCCEVDFPPSFFELPMYACAEHADQNGAVVMRRLAPQRACANCGGPMTPH